MFFQICAVESDLAKRDFTLSLLDSWPGEPLASAFWGFRNPAAGVRRGRWRRCLGKLPIGKQIVALPSLPGFWARVDRLPGWTALAFDVVAVTLFGAPPAVLT